MKKIFKYVVLIVIITVFISSACSRPRAHVAEYYSYLEDSTNINVSSKLHKHHKKVPKLVYYYKGDDSTNCKEIQYYEDGSKKMEGNYVNDFRNGTWTAWYRNGQLWSQGDYKDGYAIGTRKVYYPNGKLYIVGDYEHGKRTGDWTFYDSLGTVLKKIHY